jgi:hypothetical protein
LISVFLVKRSNIRRLWDSRYGDSRTDPLEQAALIVVRKAAFKEGFMQADRVGHACDRSVRAGLRYALSTGAIVDREVRDTADNALTQQFGVVVHSIALIPCFSCRMHDRKDPRQW